MKLWDFQERAVERMRGSFRAGHRRILLVSPTGCHAAGAELMQYDGRTAPVERVAVGDRLMGPDSCPRTVRTLIRGTGDLVRIVPAKGEPFTVNLDHVLTLVRTNDGSKLGGRMVDVSVRDWLQWSRTQRHVHKLVRTGVEFPDHGTPLPLDPYFLGVILGDGNISGSSIIEITKPDPEIRSLVESQARLFGMRVTEAAKRSCPHFRISHDRSKHVAGSGRMRNGIVMALRSLGLQGTNAGDKFVPDCYKLSNRAVRSAVLAGLLDTDGHMSGNGYDYISKSPRLAGDLAFLARSVGLAAYLKPCEKYSQWGTGGRFYRVSVSGDASDLPLRIPRKKAGVRRQKKDVLRSGFTVEPAGVGDYYGFTLDGDGRYLMADFTVTHNSGKGTIISALTQQWTANGAVVLVLAHRAELIEDLHSRIVGEGVRAGIIMQRHPLADPGARVQVASVQTLMRRAPMTPPPAYIVADEAHRSVSPSFLRVIEGYPDAILVGGTASPWRCDGHGLAGLYEDVVVAATPRELMRRGFLCEYTGVVYSVPDLSHVGKVRGDYAEHAASRVMQSSAIMGDVTGQWLAHAQNARTIAFACDREHSRRIVADFVAAGVAAEHVDGETPAADRRAALARLRDGTTRIVSNVALFTEGIDLPAVECVILARPTLSTTLAVQMIGRGLRTSPGKDRLRIHDHAGILARHGLPDADRDYTLQADVSKAATVPADASPVRVCPKCRAVSERGLDACPSCGAPFARPREDREVQPGAEPVALDALRGVSDDAPDERRTDFLALWERAQAEGRAPGWASEAFRERHGTFPNWRWMRDAG